MSTSYPESRPGAVTRRLGKVTAPTGRLAHQRIVRLTFDLAILFSAVQNFRIDLAKGYHRNISDWKDVAPDYFQEAGDLLSEQGCNYYPGKNDEPWYHVTTIGVQRKMPTAQSFEIKEAFDLIFFKNDPALFDSSLYPTPENCSTMKKTIKLVTALRHRYHFGYN